ncbi:hypothetical protein BSK56_32455 [Paenibacillus borealis]|uniref:Uncharacterized protein n=1 Tax=Paenibacillus borealis TaxID=160799 RepID=A0ABX3GSE5_PAEBO|nr:hypothetical protein BSK56_32455 [Paenibacillus borealis]
MTVAAGLAWATRETIGDGMDEESAERLPAAAGRLLQADIKQDIVKNPVITGIGLKSMLESPYLS